MEITIHRGAHEIGGNCIEVTADKTRIILDLGMPLVEPGNKQQKFESLSIKGKSTKELLDQGVLPNVTGLYKNGDGGTPPDALFLSHSHQDHYGLTAFLHPDIPVYLSGESQAVIEVSDLFLPTKAYLGKCVPLKSEKAVKVGDFRVTPYLMDHSAFGAMAFLIEADGKRLFYSGDIRGHGRKGKLFQRFLRIAPKPVDCLLMEGTTLDRPSKAIVKEEELEGDLMKIIREFPGLKLIATSPQNVDRMVTLYRAAIRTNSLLVVDLYAAHLLDQIHSFAGVPYPSPSFKNLKVFFFKKMMRHLLRNKRGDLIPKYHHFEIGMKELKANFGRSIFLFRDSMLPDVKEFGDLKGSVLIYSMYQGYMQEPKFQAVKQFLDEQDIPIRILHTSGHAPFEDLKKFVGALKAKVVVPIHTTRPDRFKELHPHIHPLSDGEPFQIP